MALRNRAASWEVMILPLVAPRPVTAVQLSVTPHCICDCWCDRTTGIYAILHHTANASAPFARVTLDENSASESQTGVLVGEP